MVRSFVVRASVAGLLLFFVVAAAGADSREALHQAALLVQEGRLDEAEQQARLALADPETEAAAYSVLGAIRFQQQRLDESAGFLKKAIQLEPRLLGAHLSLAQVYTIQEKPEQALAPFEQALELNPESVPRALSIKLGLLLAQQGLVAKSITILERANETGPSSYELAFNLAGVYLLNKEPARALDTYDEALTLRPDSLPALRQAATVAEREGELERSLAYWVRAKKIEPDTPEILLGFGRVCLKMDLLEDAEPALAKAAGLKPDEAVYQYTLAAAKVGKKQFEAAQSLLERLVQKQPKDPQLRYGLGSILYIRGRLEEAAEHLQASVRLQPKQLASYHYLALVDRDQGDDGKAIGTLEKLLQRYPDHAPSREVLGELLMSARRYREAEINLRRAVRLDPKSVKANYQLGLVLARMGKKQEATEQLEMAKTLRKKEQASSRLQLRLLDPDR